MAAERKRVWGELAAWHLCNVVGAFAGDAPDPTRINPYRPDAPPVEPTGPQRERKFQSGFRNFLKSVFGKVPE